MKHWSILIVATLLLFSRGGAVAQATIPDALQVAAAIVEQRSERLRLASAVDDSGKPMPLLLDVQSVIITVQRATGVAVSEEQVDAAIRPAFRDIPSGQATRCEPWPADPRRVSCRSIDDGYHIKFESLSPTQKGWEAVVEYSFTGEERRPGQWQIQWYRIRHLVIKEGGRWRLACETIIGQS